MRARSFSHVGITVSDFNAFVRFYWDVFKCPLVGVSDTPTERVRAFFGVDAPAPSCKIGWIRVPGGGVLEIFEFNPHKWHDYLKRKGVTIVSEPAKSPNGGQWFFFVKDCDGNLIELMDLGKMYYLLQWFGPLGGFLFRRGMYKKYYEPK
jgi:catechol 2,3-dioxygenase-like lactoylglutathione lyase family enzyme